MDFRKLLVNGDRQCCRFFLKTEYFNHLISAKGECSFSLCFTLSGLTNSCLHTVSSPNVRISVQVWRRQSMATVIELLATAAAKTTGYRRIACYDGRDYSADCLQNLIP